MIFEEEAECYVIDKWHGQILKRRMKSFHEGHRRMVVDPLGMDPDLFSERTTFSSEAEALDSAKKWRESDINRLQSMSFEIITGSSGTRVSTTTS